MSSNILSLRRSGSWIVVCAGLALAVLASSAAATWAASAHGRARATIYGYVTLKSGASPPPETVVQVLVPGTQRSIAQGKINSTDGGYEIRGISPGTYDLLAHDGGSYRKHPKLKNKIVEGDNRVDFELEHVTASGKINGVATDSARAILAGVPVILYPPECDNCEMERTVTNEQGAYEFSRLAAPESYRVAVGAQEADGSELIAIVDQTVQVIPEKGVRLNLEVARKGSQLSVVGRLPDLQPPVGPRSERDIVIASVEGGLTGRVVFKGVGVPGMEVKVISKDGRIRTAMTDSDGVCRFHNLDAGKYIFIIEAQNGFDRVVQPDIPVGLSAAAVVTVNLPSADRTETVEVTASSGAAIDVSTEQFSNFPTQRTVQSLYSIAPTVSRSGLRDASGRDRDPSVAGSSGPENNYILDGVQVFDPAFGGSGANLPFEFVQEIEIKTGAYGADIGKATGGVFNVITKSGTNDFRGDVFGYFSTKGMVRDVKADTIPFTGAAPNGVSEIDAGFDIGGPIIKDKLFFFGAFNPQRRENFYLTQTTLDEVQNKVTTPFYAGKITWQPSQNHDLNFSTFGDFTKQQGFLFGGSGFGADPNSFRGEIQTGGHNYAFRLNSTFTPNFIGEFSAGLHFQRFNTIPEASVADQALVTDSFSLLNNSSQILNPTVTPFVGSNGVLLTFVNGTGLNATSALQRDYIRQGFGLRSDHDRDRYEGTVRMQNIWGTHKFKYGLELNQNRYRINTRSTGPTQNFASAFDPFVGFRVTNNYAVCTGDTSTHTITCPIATFTGHIQTLINNGFLPGYTTATTGVFDVATAPNPILLLSSVRVRDFRLTTHGDFTHTNTESFYVQDDWKVTRNLQFNLGLRWDYQQTYGTETKYFSLNNFYDNAQPRLGFIWDFTGEGRGMIFANFARFVETPIPLDLNVRAGGDEQQIDFNINVDRVNAPAGAVSVADFGCLGCERTPIDPGLKPQTVNEWTAGIEYSPWNDFAIGFRGIYRAQRDVIEDGSFDDGTTYFIFNPGRRGNGETTEDIACTTPGIGCFGRARRYYRALEFTATKRFTDNWQLISSYVYSSLIGNYEGLFRNDNGQSDPNITSLFDLVSLLKNTYGRLPNDRPHQFKVDGTYRWPFNLLTSLSFRAQSGIPFNALIPHPVYGNNEGFEVPRGSAINPITGRNRTPTTWNLDFGAYYPIQLGENRQLKLQFDWFNVTNSQRAIRQDETFRLNSGIPGLTAAQQQQFAVSNPFYGRGTIFQFPSSFRLGAKFSF
jgi:outer membrane receptor protein involved in Fe transport